MVESYNNKMKRDMQLRAVMDTKMVQNLVSNVGALMSKDAKVPTFEDLYSFLFDDEKKNAISQVNKTKEENLSEKENAEMIRQQMAWMQYIAIHNKKIEEKGGI